MSASGAITALRELLGDAEVDGLLRLLVETGDEAMRTLLWAAEAGDLGAAQQSAHRLRSGLTQVGLDGASEALRAVEVAARAADLPALRAAVSHAQAAWAQTRTEIVDQRT